MTNGNQFQVVKAGPLFKLKRAVLSLKPSTTRIATIFHDSWIVPYGISSYQLTYNGTQFMRKVFETVCIFFGLKQLTTTAYYAQTRRLAVG